MRLRSSNPVLRSAERNILVSDTAVTYSGVAFKTVFLVLVTAIVGFFTIANLDQVSIPLLIGSMIVGFISVLIGMRSVRLAPLFAIIYAMSEGVILGFITIIFEFYYPGIALTAISTTLIVLMIMMLLYSTNIIKVNQRFASFMVVSLISIIFMSIFLLIFGFEGPLYIGVCILSTVIAALYLFMDFEHIKNCVESGADTRYGWILSLGLMVSLIWLYVEILRLLAIFARRNN